VNSTNPPIIDRLRLAHDQTFALPASGGADDSQEVDRDSYLGGTDVAAILGRNPWKTPMDVYLRKTKQAPPDPTNERMLWGLILEPVILAEYCRRAGLELVETQPFVRSETCPWMGGHIDGIARPFEIDPDADAYGDRGKPATLDDPRGLILLECKAVRRDALPKWENGIPIEYRYQGQHYLMLRGLKLCVFVVLFGGQVLRAYPMAEDPVMQAEIREATTRFWTEHVEPRIPPDATATEQPDRPEDPDAITMPASEAAVAAAMRMIAARNAAKGMDADADAARAILIDELEALDVDALTVAGKPLFTRSTRSRAAYTVEAKEWVQYELARGAAKILNAPA